MANTKNKFLLTYNSKPAFAFYDQSLCKGSLTFGELGLKGEVEYRCSYKFFIEKETWDRKIPLEFIYH